MDSTTIDVVALSTLVYGCKKQVITSLSFFGWSKIQDYEYKLLRIDDVVGIMCKKGTGIQTGPYAIIKRGSFDDIYKFISGHCQTFYTGKHNHLVY